MPPGHGTSSGARETQAGRQSTLDDANTKMQEGRPGVPASRRPGVPASRRPDCSHTLTGCCQSPLPNRNLFILIHGLTTLLPWPGSQPIPPPGKQRGVQQKPLSERQRRREQQRDQPMVA